MRGDARLHSLDIYSELSAKQACTPFDGHDAVARLLQNGEKNASVASISKNEERGQRWVGGYVRTHGAFPVRHLCYRACAETQPYIGAQTKRELEDAAHPTLRTNTPVS
jgi:hypothetical protein